MTRRVIIEGIIGAGKSVCLEELREKYPNVFPELVEEWKELEYFYQDPPKWCLEFSLRVLMTQFKQHKQAIELPEETLKIFERSPLASRHVFTQNLFNEGIMTQKKWDIYKQYYEIMKWEPEEDDLIIFIDAPADVCMDRIKKRGRECETTVSQEYLHKLQFQYKNMLKYVNCPVRYVDGTRSKESVEATVRNLIEDFIVATM